MELFEYLCLVEWLLFVRNRNVFFFFFFFQAEDGIRDYWRDWSSDVCSSDLPWAIRLPAWNWPERALDVPWPVFSPALARVLRRQVAWAEVVHSHGALYLPTLGALPYAKRLAIGRASCRESV